MMTERFSQLNLLRKKYGWKDSTRRLGAYLLSRLRGFFGLCVMLHYRKIRSRLLALLGGDYDRVILWRSGFGFHTPLYQRPQQIARQLASRRSLVLYESNPLRDGNAPMQLLEPGLLLVNLQNRPFRQLLMRELDRVERPKYLQIYSTNKEMPLSELKSYLRRGYRLIYEYVDHLSPLISGTSALPKNISDKFDYVMAHTTLSVVVTAELLRQNVIKRRGSKNLIIASNGVDTRFFQEWEDYSFEPEFQRILDRKKPIICYYGALAAWIDYELLKKIAADGRYSLVLFGVKYDGSFDEKLGGTRGIDFLGARDYRVLKYYARASDVLILPFLRSDLSRSTSPVKLFEYMALHKPIVSTDLDECRKYRSVLLARDHADFLRQLERAMALRRESAYLELLDREARDNDWSEKAKAILDGLENANVP